MKEEISCGVYRELKLLQQHQVLGPHTQKILQEHRQTCPACAQWEEQTVLWPIPDDKKILEKLRRKNFWIRLGILLLGTMVGFLLRMQGTSFSLSCSWPLFAAVGACAALLFAKNTWQAPVFLACATGTAEFLWLRFLLRAHLAVGILAKDAFLTGLFCGVWCAMGVLVVRLAGKVSMNWPKRNRKK